MLPRGGVRCGRGDVRRGGLHHRHDRLPGDAHRPVLPPAGGGADRPARRQHRGQRRGRRVRPDPGRRLRRARPGTHRRQLAGHRHAVRPAGRRGRGRHLRHRHPRAHPPPARTGGDAGRHLQPRPRPGPAAGKGARLARDARRGPHRGGDHAHAVHGAGRGCAPVHRGRAGPGHQAHRGPAAGRPRRDQPRAARLVDAGGCAGGPAGRGVPVTGAGRPGHRRPRRDAGTAGAGPADPTVRHLLRQPDPGPRARLRHLQAPVRAPGPQPAGAGPGHRPGGGHRPQPRVRRGRTGRARGGDRAGPGGGVARLPQRPGGGGAALPGRAGVRRAVPPGGRGRAARRRLPVRPVRGDGGGGGTTCLGGRTCATCW